jgi:sugar phosphate isomerase/epimerase
VKRRDFLKTAAAGAALPFARWRGLAADAPARSTMGVVAYSFPTNPVSKKALDFLELCASLGAGGVQIRLESLEADFVRRFRQRAEGLKMFYEGVVGLPDPKAPERFEREVAAAKEAGAVCLRTACLSGRRYETFRTLDEWKEFAAESNRRLRLAVSVAEKHRIPLGVENHKDWTADEFFALVREYESEYFGVCLDTGNNIAMLDDPMEFVETFAPYAVTTHIKDMGVENDPDGFLLSEVALGKGALDLPRVVETIRKARPRANFNLEMITRDPLKIPCLTDAYWETFPERNGRYLARTVRWVRENRSREPLPRVSRLDAASRLEAEEENVRESLAFARRQLGLAATS